MFIGCVLTFIGEKVNPHNRFIGFILTFKNIYKIKGWVFLKRRSCVLCVGQLAEFTICVLRWIGQKVRFIDFSNVSNSQHPI